MDRYCGKFYNAFCPPEYWGNPIGSHNSADTNYLLLAVQEENVDRVFHSEGVHCLGGKNQQPASWIQVGRTKQTNHSPTRAIRNINVRAQASPLAQVQHSQNNSGLVGHALLAALHQDEQDHEKHDPCNDANNACIIHESSLELIAALRRKELAHTLHDGDNSRPQKHNKHTRKDE